MADKISHSVTNQRIQGMHEKIGYYLSAKILSQSTMEARSQRSTCLQLFTVLLWHDIFAKS